ncbi:MAG: glycosyltransferase [Patescibacteria group bacterium]
MNFFQEKQNKAGSETSYGMNPTPEKIALVIPYMRQGGGAEKICAWLSNELAQHNTDVHLITFVERENEHKVSGTRHVLDTRYRGGIVGLVKNAWKIRRLCREHSIQKVLSFTEEANAACLLAKMLGGIPTLFLAVRNNPEFRGFLGRTFIKTFYRYANAVVANSSELAHILTDTFHLPHVVVIQNPIDVEFCIQRSMEPLPERITQAIKGKSVFVNIGRLINQKGQRHLINAFARVVKQVPESILLILGQGIHEEVLRQLVHQKNLEQHVLFLGRVENVYPYIRAARAFVLTSLFEGFPNVLLEALAMSTLVISTDCPTGPREILGAPLGERLSYPYFATHGILTQPFGGSHHKVVKAEQNLSDLLIQAPQKQFWKERYEHGQTRVATLRPHEIFLKWEKLLGA